MRRNAIRITRAAMALGLVALISIPSAYGCAQCPDIAMHWTDGPRVSSTVICVGQTVTVTATAADEDVVGTMPDCTHSYPTPTVTGTGEYTWDTPGTKTITVKATDPPTPVDDADLTVDLHVTVIRVTVEAQNKVLQKGQCRDWGTVATATVTPWPIQGCPLAWEVSSPLYIQSQSPDGMLLSVKSNEPEACEMGGVIKATVCGCVGSDAVTVKRFGPFSVTGPTSSGPTYYNGEATFMALGIAPPRGCEWTDRVYGPIEVFDYLFLSDCPLPSNTPFGEIVDPAPACPGIDNLMTGGFTIPVGTTSFPFIDRIGVYGCYYESFVFCTGTLKVQQTFWIGNADNEECFLRQQCIEVQKYSPACSCMGYQQTVIITPGLEGCNCF